MRARLDSCFCCRGESGRPSDAQSSRVGRDEKALFVPPARDSRGAEAPLLRRLTPREGRRAHEKPPKVDVLGDFMEILFDFSLS